jgi:hypothetical protein
MKKFLVLIFAGLLFSSTFGQTYHRLIKPNKYWDVQMCLMPPGICNYTNGSRYYFKGDTVIAGKLYDAIYEYSIWHVNPGPYCPPYAIDTSVTYQLWGIFMREDTMARKVYVYNNGINSDDLLYDFNLQPGDTLKSQYSYMPIIVKVSDTTLLTGDTMKVFYLNNGENYIESIGGSKGFCFPIMNFEGCSDPKCIEDNGVHLWGDECYPLLTSGVAHYEFDNTIEIFPNPATDFVELKRNNNSEITINIYDLTGRRILIKTLNNKSEKIDISLLTAGTYIYKLFGSDEKVIRGKIIKIE